MRRGGEREREGVERDRQTGQESLRKGELEKNEGIREIDKKSLIREIGQ